MYLPSSTGSSGCRTLTLFDEVEEFDGWRGDCISCVGIEEELEVIETFCNMNVLLDVIIVKLISTFLLPICHLVGEFSAHHLTKRAYSESQYAT